MVGHTGVYEAVICSMEAMDLQLARLKKAVDAAGGIMLLTADHGNADEMYELDKKGQVKRDSSGRAKAKTSHTLNPVPLVLAASAGLSVQLSQKIAAPGLSNMAATVLNLLGFEAPSDYDPSLVEPR